MRDDAFHFASDKPATARHPLARSIGGALRDLRHLASGLVCDAQALLGLLPLQPARRLSPAAAPRRLTAEEHFAHSGDIVASAKIGLKRVADYQSSAADHIDAAEYALRRMLGELATAMQLPIDGAPLRAVLAEAARTSSIAKTATAATPAASATAEPAQPAVQETEVAAANAKKPSRSAKKKGSRRLKRAA